MISLTVRNIAVGTPTFRSSLTNAVSAVSSRIWWSFYNFYGIRFSWVLFLGGSWIECLPNSVGKTRRRRWRFTTPWGEINLFVLVSSFPAVPPNIACIHKREHSHIIFLSREGLRACECVWRAAHTWKKMWFREVFPLEGDGEILRSILVSVLLELLAVICLWVTQCTIKSPFFIIVEQKAR